jgi:hypothetical protein
LRHSKESMLFALLLIPTLLMADTDLPIAVAPQSTEVATAPIVELRLKQNFDSPVAVAVSRNEIKDPMSVGKDARGVEWFTTEREVTLEGYVDNASITKDLDVVKDAKVWTTPELKELLTVIGDPTTARLLDVDKGVGHVQVKEPRVLYFASQSAPSEAEALPAPKAPAAPTPGAPTVEVSSAGDVAAATAPEASPTNTISPSLVNDAAPTPSLRAQRAIEGQLVKGGFFDHGRYYLADENGGRICFVAKDSPIGNDALASYRNRVVVLSGELNERGGVLTLKVRSIKMR